MTQTEVAALQEELAAVARKIARLLLQPGHDPAELAALDAQAAGLRARIREVEARDALRVIEFRFPGDGRMPTGLPN
ncbi:MAG TPA: hypothetical protein VFJ16_01900 [Longimicrobium sp.]|nr:hypothetical protein [Longimicrobium sp.]